jgi:hypothetical protein
VFQHPRLCSPRPPIHHSLLWCRCHLHVHTRSFGLSGMGEVLALDNTGYFMRFRTTHDLKAILPLICSQVPKPSPHDLNEPPTLPPFPTYLTSAEIVSHNVHSVLTNWALTSTSTRRSAFREFGDGTEAAAGPAAGYSNSNGYRNYETSGNGDGPIP